MRPRTVLVTGAPGSGKSTLGRRLAEHLRTPFLARDDVRGGMLLTNGSWAEQLGHVPSAQDALDLFLRVADSILDGGASCVVEYVVRSDQEWVLDRLRAHGTCLVVITRCDQAISRYVERAESEPLLSAPAVLAATGHRSPEEFAADSVARMEQVAQDMMREFRDPTLTVDTSSGYDPSFGTVVDFATQPLDRPTTRT